MAMDSTLIIIGSGALDKAWDPVIAGMVAAGHEMVRTPGSANFDLARTVYMGRQLDRYDDRDSGVVEHKNIFRRDLDRLKSEIAAALFAAEQNGCIQTRSEGLSKIGFDDWDWRDITHRWKPRRCHAIEATAV